ncbi:hypothetical protein [Burkholderia pseudomultivorans]|uniref:hypothetical protein n=1 Tax=Burkholderia pseudomultivorans TaxID=1207504 RepID=UPI00158B0CD2|nr:hypothetical protein [Burkholderia pseudomultivorans]
MLLDYRSVEIGVFLVHPSRRRGEAKTRAWADFMKTALRDALWRERRDNPECAAESGDGIREVSFPAHRPREYPTHSMHDTSAERPTLLQTHITATKGPRHAAKVVTRLHANAGHRNVRP